MKYEKLYSQRAKLNNLNLIKIFEHVKIAKDFTSNY